ncbi:MAG TPA: sulfatase-like hydrolase/transferase [Thermoplasmata archaeon]|nr:sulfatase-like hydrolase/transferase [Thermoplasmata archaeon]
MAKRNLVIIVADTLREPAPFDRPGAPSMPFLYEMARDATRFDRLFASSSWTAPSHVSLLTGAPPWETHFHVPGLGPRAPAAVSLADRWRKAGGTAVGFSANFLVAPSLGTATGYTRFNPGFRSGLAGYFQLAVTFGGYERSLYRAYQRSASPHAGGFSRALEGATRWGGTGVYKSINAMRTTDTLLRPLGKFLAQRAQSADRVGTPLHLFMNIAEPHEPYLVGQNGGPAGSRATMGHVPSINLARFNDLLVDRNDPAPFVDAYRASLEATDAALRSIVGLLRRRGVLDDAALLLVSDHGQNLGEHGFYGHGCFLHDELVKVPGWLWEFQGGRPVGQTAPPEEWIDHRHLNDLLAAFTPDGGGVDLHDVLAASLAQRGPACSYYEGPGPRPPDGLLVKALRSEPYRLVRVQRGNETAQIRSTTKGESIGPWAVGSADSVSAELAEIGERILRYDAMKASAPSGAPGAMDAQVDARLKSWGYD